MTIERDLANEVNRIYRADVPTTIWHRLGRLLLSVARLIGVGIVGVIAIAAMLAMFGVSQWWQNRQDKLIGSIADLALETVSESVWPNTKPVESDPAKQGSYDTLHQWCIEDFSGRFRRVKPERLPQACSCYTNRLVGAMTAGELQRLIAAIPARRPDQWPPNGASAMKSAVSKCFSRRDFLQ